MALQCGGEAGRIGVVDLSGGDAGWEGGSVGAAGEGCDLERLIFEEGCRDVLAQLACCAYDGDVADLDLRHFGVLLMWSI